MKQKLLSLTLFVVLITSAIGYAAIGAVTSAKADTVITNDNNQVVTYEGAWTYTANVSGYQFNDYHSSETSGDYVEFSFSGNAISILATTGPTLGQADVYLDSALQETVDLYSATEQSGVVIWTEGNMTIAPHTVRMVVDATKNTSSSGYTVDLDAFRFDDGSSSHQFVDDTIKILVGALTISGHGGSPGGSIVCTPGTGGSDTKIVCDGTITGSTLTGTTQFDGTIELAITPFAQANKTLNYDIEILSTSNGSATCYPYACGIGQIANWTSNTGASAFDIALVQTNSGTSSVSFHAVFAFEQLDDCYKRYVYLLTAGPYIIDPTIETPKGPNAVSPDVPDEQIYPVTPGGFLAVRIAGGPWHNGAGGIDNYNYQYSFDGVTYQHLHDAACTVKDPTNEYLYTVYLEVPAGASEFYIRADDGDNPPVFSDNTSSTDPTLKPQYFISYVFSNTATDCTSQFSYDPSADWVASTIVDASQPYVQVDGAFTPGDWYVIQVASGSWQDDGVPPDRYDGQYSWGNVMDGSGDGANFNDIGTSESSFCVSNDGNYSTIYVQADASPSYDQNGATSNLYLRVGDTSLTFPANTGHLGVNVYHTSFTYKPNVCELQYGTNELGGHSVIDAKQENGVTIGISYPLDQLPAPSTFSLKPGSWYMLETSGGPWGWVGDTHSDKSYDLAIKWNGEWVPLSQWAGSGASCNVQIDDLGHRRVFFQAPATGATEYTLRVNDTSTWWNNTGQIGVDLYKAHDMGTDPSQGQCDYKYDPNQTLPWGDIWIDSKVANGVTWAQTLAVNTTYALEIYEDPGSSFWQETASADPQYDLQLSDDGGSTWHDLPNSYGGVLCYTQTSGMTTLFFRTGANYLYRLRVNSTSFGDNVGTMRAKLFLASPGNTIDPWTSGCLNAFGSAGSTAKKFLLSASGIQLHLDPQKSEGKPILWDVNWLQDPSILGYAVEVTEGPWNKNDGVSPDQHYDAAVSKDNGTTWHAIGLDNPDILCAEDDALHMYWTAYFKVENGDTWKIRVNDEDGADWGNNGGHLWFKVYAITDQVAPDCVIDTNRADCLPPGTVIGWNGQDVCTMANTAPEVPTTLDVPDWLSYLSGVVTYNVMGISQWMAWCPWHTDTLMNLLNSFKDKEPMATIQELQQLVLETQKQLNAYNWNDGNAPEELLTNNTPDAIMHRLFPPMTSSNPWNGGKLLPSGFASVNVSSYSYYNSCVAESADFLGSYLPKSICFVSLWWRETTISLWLQIIFDVMLIGVVIKRIKKKATELAYFMAGSGAYVSSPDVKVTNVVNQVAKYK